MKNLRHYMRVGKILEAARDIVASRWTKGSFTKDGSGKDIQDLGMAFGVPDDDDPGYRYCGDGALRRAVKNAVQNAQDLSKTQGAMVLHTAQNALTEAILQKGGAAVSFSQGPETIWQFNDSCLTTQEDMLAVFDKAIEDNCAVVRQKAGEEHPDEDQRLSA